MGTGAGTGGAVGSGVGGRVGTCVGGGVLQHLKMGAAVGIFVTVPGEYTVATTNTDLFAAENHPPTRTISVEDRDFMFTILCAETL